MSARSFSHYIVAINLKPELTFRNVLQAAEKQILAAYKDIFISCDIEDNFEGGVSWPIGDPNRAFIWGNPEIETLSIGIHDINNQQRLLGAVWIDCDRPSYNILGVEDFSELCSEAEIEQLEETNLCWKLVMSFTNENYMDLTEQFALLIIEKMLANMDGFYLVYDVNSNYIVKPSRSVQTN